MSIPWQRIRYWLALPVLIVLLQACNPVERGAPAPAPVLERLSSGTTHLLVAADAVDSRTIWASGAGGTILRTTDGGNTWQLVPIPETDTLQFRDIHAFDSVRAVAMSAGPGPASRIYRTEDGGQHWTLAFTAPEPEAFLDCLDFWDETDGLAYGDTVDGHPYILFTRDGGRSWSRIPTDSLPPALPGEGGFAASGTCVTTGDTGQAWIATGNASEARILYTMDRGAGWEVVTVPVHAGEAAGLTAVAFHDTLRGVVLGGDIAHPDTSVQRIARTRDGGRTWRPVSSHPFPGPVYGATYVPERDDVVLIATGPSGAALSYNHGDSWVTLDSLAYWGLTAIPYTAFIVGPEGRITRISVDSTDT